MAEPSVESEQVRHDDALVLWCLTILAVFAALLARGVNPALPGVWVGADYAITGLKLVAALSSQLFAVLAAAVGVTMVVATVRSGLPPLAKLMAAVVGPLVVLSVMTASAVRLHSYWAVGIGIASTMFALFVASRSSRYSELRAGALVLGIMASAGLIRVSAVAGTYREELMAEPLLAGLMTISSMLELLALVVALGGLAPVLRKHGKKSWPITMVVLLLASIVGACVAYLGGQAEAGGVGLLWSRALNSLLSGPAPFVPHLIRLWFECLCWLTLCLVLLRAPRHRLLWCAVALTLVGRATPEQPLCGMALFLAALALAHDRGPGNEDLPVLERAA